MPLPSPKPSTFDPVQSLNFTLDPNTGAISTAFPTPKPAPAQPIAAPALDVPTEAGPSPEELRLQEEEVGVGPSPFEQFAPGSAFEEVAAQSGSQSTVFGQAFKEGVLGFDNKVSSLAERERISSVVAASASEKPWTTVATQIAGRAASDLPIDVSIGLVSGPLGASLQGLRSSMRLVGASMSRRLNAAHDTFKAARLAQRTGSTAGFTAKTLQHAKIDSLEGLATGAISETFLQNMGKEGDSKDVMNAAIADSIGGVVFGFGLRNAFSLSGKTFNSFMENYKSRAAKDLNESTGVPEVDIKSKLDEVSPKTEADIGRKQEPDVDETVVRKAEGQTVRESELTKPDDVDVPLATKTETSGVMSKSADEFNAKPTKGRLRKWLDEAILPEDAPRINDILDSIDSRVKSSGLTFKNYMKAKGLEVGSDEVLSVLTKEGKLLLTSPKRAASASDLLHEVGHIIRSDLGGKHLSDLEAKYGIEKGGVWNRAQEENFADDIRDFLDDKLTAPRRAKRAIRAFVDKVEQIYRKIFGMPARATRNEVFAQLFSEVEGLGINIPTAAKEAKVAKGRIGSGVDRLKAPGQTPSKGGVEETGVDAKIEPTAKTKKVKTKPREELPSDQLKEIADASNRIERRQENIRDNVVRSVEEGEVTAKTTRAKNWSEFKKKAGRFLGSDNVDLNSVLSQFGRMGVKIRDKFYPAAENEASIIIEGNSAYSASLKKAKIDHADLTELYNGTQKADLGGKTWTKPPAWWVQQVLYAMDGFSKSKDEFTALSGQEKLLSDGLVIDGKKIKLKKNDVDFLQKGALLTDKQKAIVSAIQDGRRQAGVGMDGVAKPLVGRGITNPENFYYTNLHTAADSEVDGLIRALEPSKDAAAGRGLFHERTGNAPLLADIDPIADMKSYIRFAARTVSYAEVQNDLKTFMKFGGESIQKSGGKALRKTMDDLVAILGGDSKILGATDDTFLSKIYSLTVIGQLGLSPSVNLKQFGSGWTAAALQLLKNEDGSLVAGGALVIDAGKIRANNKVRMAGRAEMDSHSNYFKNRRESRVRWVEIDEIVSNIGVFEIDGELSVKEVIKLVKAKGISKFDAQLAVLEKATDEIQNMDEAMMIAIWNKAKDTIKKGDSDYWKKVNTLAQEIAMESQPTGDMVSKSFNQLKKGLPNKALVQYTNATRKVIQIANKSVTKYLNLEVKDMKPAQVKEARAELINSLVPLMVQTAYAAAIGTVVGTGVAGIKDQFKTEAQRKAVEARRDSLAKKFLGNMIQGTFGIVPVSGPVLSGLLSGVLGLKPYAQSIPIFSQLQQMSDAAFERNIVKGMKSAGGLVGIPSIIVAPTASSINTAITE